MAEYKNMGLTNILRKMEVGEIKTFNYDQTTYTSLSTIVARLKRFEGLAFSVSADGVINIERKK
jgi:hypothetical protein